MFDFNKYNNEINEICIKYDVNTLIAFGSSLSDDFSETSDIDFLLDLKNPQKGLSKYMGLKQDLEELFNLSVDLVMPKAIKNTRIRKYIYSNTRTIYAA